MTHDELVTRAGSWLRNTLRCGVVFEELSSAAPEIPDAVGWVSGKCVVVECKTSKADFRADRKKWHRSHGENSALGVWRFYLAPAGVIPHEEIPSGWGLYEVHGRRVIHATGLRYANMKPPPFTSNIRRENTMLLSALRRSQQKETKVAND